MAIFISLGRKVSALIPDESSLGRIKAKLRSVRHRIGVALSQVDVIYNKVLSEAPPAPPAPPAPVVIPPPQVTVQPDPVVTNHYSATCRHLAELFQSAMLRLPATDFPLSVSYAPFLFDLVLKRTPCDPAVLLQLWKQLETLVQPCRAADTLDRVEAAPSTFEKMDILFVTAIFPAVEHAGGLRIFDIITELAQRGHRVSLFSAEDAGGSRRSLELLQPYLWSYRTVKWEELTVADYESWLRRQDIHFNAIHYVWPQTAPYVGAGRQWTRHTVFELIESCTRRCVLDTERFLAEGDIVSLERAALELSSNWTLEHKALSATDTVIALTEADATFTRQVFGASAIRVVPTGISKTMLIDRVARSDAASVPPRFGDASAVFLGNYNHYPNKDGVKWFLEKVHDKVVAAVPSFKFVVAGAGSFPEIKGLIGGRSSVEFLGEVEDLVDTLLSGKICLSPLISGAGFRGKVNQYSAVRRPTVSTKIGACGTPYEHGRSILIADDPDEYADLVISLLRDSKLYESIRVAAYGVALGQFAWDPHISNLEAIYAE